MNLSTFVTEVMTVDGVTMRVRLTLLMVFDPSFFAKIFFVV